MANTRNLFCLHIFVSNWRCVYCPCQSVTTDFSSSQMCVICVFNSISFLHCKIHTFTLRGGGEGGFGHNPHSIATASTFRGPMSHSTALVYRLDYFPLVTPVIRLHPLRISAATREYQQQSSLVFTLGPLQTLPAAPTIRRPTITWQTMNFRGYESTQSEPN